MKDKKYALVRVDSYIMCPSHFEKIKNENVCCIPKDAIKVTQFACDNCRYGDTKQQLQNKIITALEIAGIDYVQLSKQDIAEAIIKFLGVE